MRGSSRADPPLGVVVGRGAATAGHVLSAPAPALRLGSLPFLSSAAMASSTHDTPDSDAAWLVPRLPSIRLAVGNSARAASAPENGVAASYVSFVSSTGPVKAAPFTTDGTALPATGHVRHGALNQAFAQARYGESWSATALSAAQTFQSVGHGASVQEVARYIA